MTTKKTTPEPEVQPDAELEVQPDAEPDTPRDALDYIREQWGEG